MAAPVFVAPVAVRCVARHPLPPKHSASSPRATAHTVRPLRPLRRAAAVLAAAAALVAGHPGRATTASTCTVADVAAGARGTGAVIFDKDLNIQFGTDDASGLNALLLSPSPPSSPSPSAPPVPSSPSPSSSVTLKAPPVPDKRAGALALPSPSLALEARILARLLVALVVGGIIGMERRAANSLAGVRTFSLVSLGAAVFMSTCLTAFPHADPSRVAAAISSSVGFLGAGAMHKNARHSRGLTTASSVWLAAALGIAAAAGLFLLSFSGAVVTVVIARYARFDSSLHLIRGDPLRAAALMDELHDDDSIDIPPVPRPRSAPEPDPQALHDDDKQHSSHHQRESQNGGVDDHDQEDDTNAVQRSYNR